MNVNRNVNRNANVNVNRNVNRNVNVNRRRRRRLPWRRLSRRLGWTALPLGAGRRDRGRGGDRLHRRRHGGRLGAPAAPAGPVLVLHRREPAAAASGTPARKASSVDARPAPPGVLASGAAVFGDGGPLGRPHSFFGAAAPTDLNNIAILYLSLRKAPRVRGRCRHGRAGPGHPSARSAGTGAAKCQNLAPKLLKTLDSERILQSAPGRLARLPRFRFRPAASRGTRPRSARSRSAA